MKRIFATAVIALFSSSAFATSAGYEMKMDLSINGKLVSSPRVIALAGEKASVTQRLEKSKNGTFIEVVATEDQGEFKGILMKFVVGTIDRDGKKTILATPSIIATENEKAEVSVSDNGKQEYALSVIASRKSLQAE
jgi:type II secretory pathway component GspD/PulD (secretin)